MIHQAVLVAVGGKKASKKSEKLEHGNWTDIEEPPSYGNELYSYAVVFHGGYHYYFGGYLGGRLIYGNWIPYSTDGDFGFTLRLEEYTWIWSKIGKMKSRWGHAAIVIGDRFMIIGGDSDNKNVARLLQQGDLSCTELSSSLFLYYKTPAVFLVDADIKNC